MAVEMCITTPAFNQQEYSYCLKASVENTRLIDTGLKEQYG